MILRNVGSKIVNVGTNVLMPGDEMHITKETGALPSINALVKHGFLALEKEASDDAPVKKKVVKTAKAVVAEPAVETPNNDEETAYEVGYNASESTDEAVSEEVPEKKRRRRKTAE